MTSRSCYLTLLLVVSSCFDFAAGAVDSTLLEAADILPTVADLAGLVPAAAAAAAAGGGAANNSSDGRPPATAAAAVDGAAAAAAQLIQDKPWDGISFKNLLLPVTNSATNNMTTTTTSSSSGSSSSSGGYRGTSLATQQQLSRYVFSVSAHCWSPDAVPHLDENRCA
jgi:hypothetical protein